MSQAIHQLDLTPFRTPFFLANPHIQTMLPKLIAQPMPAYRRKLYPDSSGTTQVAYDFIDPPTGISPDDQNKANKPLAVMFHGLEGSSESHYAISFANFAHEHGWQAVIVHYRGCGGVENTAHADYHAGDTQELHHVLTMLQPEYETMVCIGVSLGGNMLARYMGEYGDDALCQAAVAVSAPVDLASAAKAMHRFIAKNIYTPYLLKPLLTKALIKLDDTDAKQAMLLAKLKNIKTIDVFDDLYTGPHHGYGSGQDYYEQASALPVLKNITKPTLIITAKDDPFLGKLASLADVSAMVRLLYSEHGGHVGFVQYCHGVDLSWLPATTFDFFAAVIPSSGS